MDEKEEIKDVIEKEEIKGAIITINENATILEAARLMKKNTIGSLLIVEGYKALGIITERDIMHCLANEKDPKITLVSEVMTKELITVPLRSRYEDVKKIMLKHNFRHIPVIDEQNDLIGILSLRDILRVEEQHKQQD